MLCLFRNCSVFFTSFYTSVQKGSFTIIDIYESVQRVLFRELESEQAVAPLRGHAGTAVSRHCGVATLRQKKGDLRIPTSGKVL